jgi:hypothetical protein
LKTIPYIYVYGKGSSNDARNLGSYQAGCAEEQEEIHPEIKT